MWVFIIIGGSLVLLSLLFLINRIYIYDDKIEFKFIAFKKECLLSDIKEIYVDRDLIFGVRCIFNFDNEVGKDCSSHYEYVKLLKQSNYKNCRIIDGMALKDFKKVIMHYNGKIQNKF